MAGRLEALSPHTHTATTFVAVQANIRGVEWFAATVSKVAFNAGVVGYSLCYDDGEMEMNVPQARVRRLRTSGGDSNGGDKAQPSGDTEERQDAAGTSSAATSKRAGQDWAVDDEPPRESLVNLRLPSFAACLNAHALTKMSAQGTCWAISFSFGKFTLLAMLTGLVPKPCRSGCPSPATLANG